MKRLLFAALSAALVSLPTTSAWARSEAWDLVSLPGGGHVVAYCGSAPIDVTWPVNQEYQRTFTLQDGTVVTQITGRITVRLVAESGKSLTLNVSGPAKVLEYPNGDVEVQNNGLAGGPPPIPGLPDLIWTQGRADVIYHPDGTITVVEFPRQVLDVCEALGL